MNISTDNIFSRDIIYQFHPYFKITKIRWIIVQTFPAIITKTGEKPC